jgi:UDPglucose--hexose-1-phosphate uridylyltransferase
MSEFRKDPLHNKWVLIVPTRGKRPHAFSYEDVSAEKRDEKICPFCEGNESMTPPEVDSIRKKGKENEPGWLVRVFPNKYPALNKEIKNSVSANKFPDIVEGQGFHEVIAETPEHSKDIYSMNQDEILLILKMYRKRYKILKEKKNVKSVFIFKNHGQSAGASLSHSHSQILALPIVPPFIEEETEEIKKAKFCIYCRLIEKAFEGNRVLLENSGFIVFAPYASEYPYQLLILPKKHQPFFEEVEDEQLVLLSEVIKVVFDKYKKLLGNIPFNSFLSTHYVKKGHWNIQIMPKLTIHAGFEKGTGISINPVPPENAVIELKRV